MTSVVFSTPGLIPIEAFTTFGMSAKPESRNPFGKFGTGLKIAVAVCLRLGQEVVVWRGRDKYTFYTGPIDFRGKEFHQVRMRRETWHVGDIFRKSYHNLPFTTELGKHWELWQAFREFQTNTMDENGETYLNNHSEGYIARGHDVQSFIIVTGVKFVDEYHDRGRNFLEDGLTVREDDARIQVLDKPSKHVYFRGVRVWDLKQEAQYTYNFLMDIDLTEDRTAKYPFILESYICEHIMQSSDEEFIDRTVKRPAVDSFERALSYRYTSDHIVPSAPFKAAATASPNINAQQLVKLAEEKRDRTVIRIQIPKFLEDSELDELKKAVHALHDNAVITIVGADNAAF